MDIITDNFNNITLSQLNIELSKKYAQLDKVEQESVAEVSKTNSINKDYIEQSVVDGKYDKNDFEKVLQKYKTVDADIRSHEQVHATIGATTTPISYNYQQGPDGKMYAVGGSVKLDVSIPNDPKAAISKLDQLSKAVSGVDNMSGADLAIASAANTNKAILQLQEGKNENS